MDFILNGRTDLHIFISATTNPEIYVYGVLDHNDKLFRRIIDINFPVMDYNVHPSCSVQVTDCLDGEEIRRIIWHEIFSVFESVRICVERIRASSCTSPHLALFKDFKVLIIF